MGFVLFVPWRVYQQEESILFLSSVPDNIFFLPIFSLICLLSLELPTVDDSSIFSVGSGTSPSYYHSWNDSRIIETYTSPPPSL